ncbi:amino acid permease [Acetobacter conturbans]|uniref:Amino acid permease n=1 Tax=Acetobacter conturbans TaxID=1737472 RepID=A0ABX0K1Q5_9PROT|nr:amino acid permease [Acetobacter conturbans]NHN89097.1 amino acid permease [Acetobacter conturbans]
MNNPDSPAEARLKSRHIAMIALGGILGAGLFVGSSTVIAVAGPTVIISYLLTGLLVMLVLNLLGDMVLGRPGLGTFIHYIARGLGPWAGFTAGWLYWCFWAIIIGSEAIAGALLLQPWIPLPVWMVSLVLVAVVTGVNLASPASFGEVEFWLAAIKVASIVGFLFLGLAFVSHVFGHAPPVTDTLFNHGGFAPHGLAAILVCVPLIMSSMMGSEIATIAAAESEDAERNLARVTRSTVLRVCTFYIASVAMILCIVPWETVTSGQSPFLAALDRMTIPGGATIIRIVSFSAVFSCLNSSVYVTSRTLSSLAAAGQAPRWLGAPGPGRTPAKAVLFSAAIGMMLGYTSILAPGAVFAFLMTACGDIILFIYLAMVIAHGRMIRSGDLPRRPGIQLYPWANVIAGGGIVAVLTGIALDSGQRLTLFGSLGLLALTLLSYGLINLHKSREHSPGSSSIVVPS